MCATDTAGVARDRHALEIRTISRISFLEVQSSEICIQISTVARGEDKATGSWNTSSGAQVSGRGNEPVANSVPDTQPAFAHASRELRLGRRVSSVPAGLAQANTPKVKAVSPKLAKRAKADQSLSAFEPRYSPSKKLPSGRSKLSSRRQERAALFLLRSSMCAELEVDLSIFSEAIRIPSVTTSGSRPTLASAWSGITTARLVTPSTIGRGLSSSQSSSKPNTKPFNSSGI